MIGLVWNTSCGYDGMTYVPQMTAMGLEFLAYGTSHADCK